MLNEFKFNKNIIFNSALFLVIGDGFFDYDGSWSIYYDDYFRLKANGFDSTNSVANALIRAQVENNQFGWIPRLSIKHNNGEFIIGGEFRRHRSEHWGSINYAENLPANLPKDYRYYFYNGKNNIINGFAHESYNLSNSINLLGEVQLAYHKTGIYNEKYLNNNFNVEGLYLNPRAGINYKLSKFQNIFFSFARVTREPRLKNYYDAAESSAGEVPQFEQNAEGSYDFNNPLVKPETMNDFEIGSSFQNSLVSFSANAFYMLFDNEIVKNGKLDRFGQPITGNVDQTLHSGLEISASVKPVSSLNVFGNATFSKNEIKHGKYFIDSDNSIDLSGNRISGFPDFLANFGVTFKLNGLFLQINDKYVGAFYSDNYDKNLKQYLQKYPDFVSYGDNKNEAYSVTDFYASYEALLFDALTPTKIYVQVNNIFNKLYSANAIGKEFFPAAERNFLAGIQIGL